MKTVEQMVRELLVVIQQDGWLMNYLFAERDPMTLSSGELVAVANALAAILREGRT